MNTDYIFIVPDVLKCGDVLPENCKKEKIDLGAVPDEIFTAFGVIDDLFEGLESNSDTPTPHPIIPNNQIWYTTTDGEIYPLKEIIANIRQAGFIYNGPEISSNKWDNGKNMFVMTFDSDVTVIGDIDLTAIPTANGPFFCTNPDYGVACNVQTITLPDSITYIGYGGFTVCLGLTSIEIPDSVTSIGIDAFFGCSSLTSVTIGNSVTSIGDEAFYQCGSLTSVTFPNSVTSIGEYAFSGCTGITSIEIPNSVTSIGEYAFRDCTGLASIMCVAATPAELGNYVFDSTNDCPIYVPSQSVDAYKVAPGWSDYANRIVSLLNNNQIRYTANEQLTIKAGVDYTEHTFNNGLGIVTFNNDLTTLEYEWFGNTFDNYTGNITSLTLPNGVSSIEMSALSGTNTVYYEGTQKECTRIAKNWLDGTGVIEYHCFDGEVSEYYQANSINSYPWLWQSVWFENLIGEEAFRYLIIILASVKIDEHPMTAGEFITNLVNGAEGIPGLSSYGFTVVNQEYEGVTIPLAYHAESEHFIGIVKATDYADLGLVHIAHVAVNESLDPDYMYILLDDTAIKPEPEPTFVSVTIEYEDGGPETISLDANQTYADQGYNGYYSQNWYNSNDGESDTDFLVDNNYPGGGDIIYDYCNDIMIDITIYKEIGETENVKLRKDISFVDQGYEGYYISDTYDSEIGETPDIYSANNRYPGENLSPDPGTLVPLSEIYDYCNDIAPEVVVTIEHEDGTFEKVHLNPNGTYSDQGYNGYYSQNWYNSNEGETPDMYSADSDYPYEGGIIYDYCNPE